MLRWRQALSSWALGTQYLRSNTWCSRAVFVVMMDRMRTKLRFLWNATKGHRLAPWRSPYLLWRIETYTGVKMTQIGFLEFWEFVWRERNELWRFLKWTGEMERWVNPKPKNS
ncbi:MAG: hypothetical protein ABSG34_17965 [Candidatus Sulfotelmatobacter sp.]